MKSQKLKSIKKLNLVSIPVSFLFNRTAFKPSCTVPYSPLVLNKVSTSKYGFYNKKHYFYKQAQAKSLRTAPHKNRNVITQEPHPEPLHLKSVVYGISPFIIVVPLALPVDNIRLTTLLQGPYKTIPGVIPALTI
jgi:hypothetical protein